MELEDVREKAKEFNEEHTISDIILLGVDGAIRRFVFGEDPEDEDEEENEIEE